MQRQQLTPRTTVRLAVLALLACLLIVAGLSLVVYRAWEATAYPGATLVSDTTKTSYDSNVVTRRTSVYRTTDTFSKVYNFYSVGFDLGPESYAQGTCILMSKSGAATFRTDEQMSVMLCDTPNDRMIFVMRSFIVRVPKL